MLTEQEDDFTFRLHDEARVREEVEHYGGYIRDLDDWTWFGTLTSRHKGGPSVTAVNRFLHDIEAAAGHPIRWVIAWEYGEIGGHLHCHFLVSKVGHLVLAKWLRRANAQFGQAHIVPYDKSQGGSFYVAQNGCSNTGRLDFGGNA